MNSIGIFWSNIDNTEDPCSSCPHQKTNKTKVEESNDLGLNQEFDLQINFWNVLLKKINQDVSSKYLAIDLGIIAPKTLKKIALLLPFKFEVKDFIDLANLLGNNKDLLCTVFNEDVTISSEPAKSYHLIKSNDWQFIMYELSKENISNCIFDDESNTTILEIVLNTDFSSESLSDHIFIRFRLPIPSLDCFAKKKSISNDWLQSAFSSTYLFDIRINDVRELPKKKKEYLENEGYILPKYKKIHFFYMSDTEEIITNGSSISCDTRLLEKEKWNPYFVSHCLSTDNLAHHWKSTAKESLSIRKIKTDSEKQTSEIPFEKKIKYLDSFSLFYKTEFSELNSKRLTKYVLLLLLFGVISSSFVSLLSIVFKPTLLSFFYWSFIIIILLLICIKFLYKK